MDRAQMGRGKMKVAAAALVVVAVSLLEVTREVRPTHRGEPARPEVHGPAVIVALVLDANGGPAGNAQVVLSGGAGTVADDGPPLVRARTGADGTTSLEVPAAVAERWRRASRAGHAVTAHVVARLDSAESDPVVVDWRKGGRYRLRLGAAPREGSPLIVNVVEDDGTPAPGVEVAVGVRGTRFASGVTGADGTVRLATEWRSRAEGLGVGPDLRATCDVAAPEPPIAPIREENWAGEPVVLRLPAAGRVIVRLTREKAEGTVALAWQPLGPRRRVVKARLRDGGATFARVGTGLELTVNARLDDARLHAAPVEAGGPQRAGDEVLIELPVSRREVIAVRIVDSRGRGVATGWAYEIVSAADPGRVLLASHARASGRGMIGVPIPSRARAEMELRVRELDPRECGLERTRVGSARLPAAGGVEVVVDDDAATNGTVHGVVLDEEGRPLKAVTVVVRESGGKRLRTTSTDRQGEFSVTDLLIGKRVDVFAGRPGYLGDERTGQVVAADTPGLELQLKRAAGLRGRLLLDRDTPLTGIEILAGGRSSGCVTGGHWAFLSLRPGEVRVAVDLFGTDWRLYESGTIRVVAGQTVELEPINLVGCVRRLDIRLTRADGTPVASARVRFVDDDGEGTFGLRTDERGRVRALVPAARTRLWVEVAGFARTPCAPDAEAIALRALD